MDSESGVSNRNLLKELIELRQIKAERESILRTNQYYIAQVSQMEIKISELKASLQAKESEINYLNNKLEETEENQEKNPNLNKNLEEQIIMLEAENEHLKLQLQEAGENSQLKIQLEYALKMKETFEEKYREAKTLLLTNRSVGHSESINDKDIMGLNNKLTEELALVKKQLSQYQSQCAILIAENDELLKKIDKDEPRESNQQLTKQKPLTEKTTMLDPYKLITSSSSTNYSEYPKTLNKSPDTPNSKTSSYSTIPKVLKLNSSKHKSSLMSTQKSVGRNEVVEYCPSFMRNKRNDYKITPTPSVKKNSINSFTDEFPDELA